MLMHRPSQRGAATVEFYLVCLLALLPLCLGMVQTSLLLVDNHHVDHAAFMAARSGATHHGDIESMRKEFARVLTPLFVAGGASLDSSNIVGRVGAAQARALADIAAWSTVRVLSPDPAARQDFAVVREGVRAIPSDALDHRASEPGARSGLTLQQANILRVEFTYCRPMVVPFIRGIMTGLLRQIDSLPAHARCYAAGRVPLRSTGVAPMQSDFIVSTGTG